MTNSESKDLPWVLFRVENQLLAVDSLAVQEMIAIPPVTEVPHTPAWVRGVFNLRGQVIPLVDLRVRFGMEQYPQKMIELAALLKRREQDLLAWLDELEKSVAEQREFEGQTDPDRCKFGLWYREFRTEHVLLAQLLSKFDKPHRKLHEVAQQIKDFQGCGDHESAMRLISRTRNSTLGEIGQLVERAQHLIQESMTETALVLKIEGKVFGVTADSIEAVEKFKGGSVEELPDMLSNFEDLVEGVAKRDRSDEIALMLNIGELLPTALSA